MHNQLAKAIGCRTLRVLSHTGLTEVFISVSVATFLQRGSSVAAIFRICSGMSLHVIHGHIPTGVSCFSPTQSVWYLVAHILH